MFDRGRTVIEDALPLSTIQHLSDDDDHLLSLPPARSHQVAPPASQGTAGRTHTALPPSHPVSSHKQKLDAHKSISKLIRSGKQKAAVKQQALARGVSGNSATLHSAISAPSYPGVVHRASSTSQNLPAAILSSSAAASHHTTLDEDPLPGIPARIPPGAAGACPHANTGVSDVQPMMSNSPTLIPDRAASRWASGSLLHSPPTVQQAASNPSAHTLRADASQLLIMVAQTSTARQLGSISPPANPLGQNRESVQRESPSRSCSSSPERPRLLSIVNSSARPRSQQLLRSELSMLGAAQLVQAPRVFIPAPPPRVQSLPIPLANTSRRGTHQQPGSPAHTWQHHHQHHTQQKQPPNPTADQTAQPPSPVENAAVQPPMRTILPSSVSGVMESDLTPDATGRDKQTCVQSQREMSIAVAGLEQPTQISMTALGSISLGAGPAQGRATGLESDISHPGSGTNLTSASPHSAGHAHDAECDAPACSTHQTPPLSAVLSTAAAALPNFEVPTHFGDSFGGSDTSSDEDDEAPQEDGGQPSTQTLTWQNRGQDPPLQQPQEQQQQQRKSRGGKQALKRDSKKQKTSAPSVPQPLRSSPTPATVSAVSADPESTGLPPGVSQPPHLNQQSEWQKQKLHQSSTVEVGLYAEFKADARQKKKYGRGKAAERAAAEESQPGVLSGGQGHSGAGTAGAAAGGVPRHAASNGGPRPLRSSRPVFEVKMQALCRSVAHMTYRHHRVRCCDVYVYLNCSGEQFV